MGAESSSPAMEGAKRGERPCTPPSSARLMKDAPDVKLIVEPQPTPPADESRRVERALSLRLLSVLRTERLFPRPRTGRLVPLPCTRRGR